MGTTPQTDRGEETTGLTARECELIDLLADLTVRAACFETLARRWLVELSTERATADQLREELRRYTESRM